MTTVVSYQDIVAAIPQGVTPFFQPIAWVDGRISYEALARLSVGQPHARLLEPRAFLPFIEGEPELAELDCQMIARALHEVSRWNLRVPLPISLHVNVSDHVLVDPSFPAYLQELLVAHQVAPELLTVEILEHSQFWHRPEMLRVLAAIRRLGVHLAVDDFPNWEDPEGLLAWLRSDPLGISILKLDRSITTLVCAHTVAQSEFDRVVGYIETARRAGLRVVAEGIETTDQAVFMQCLGVDALQGYGIGRPAPASAVYHLGLAPEELGGPYGHRASDLRFPTPH